MDTDTQRRQIVANIGRLVIPNPVPPRSKHVTIAVSGAHGGYTIDFRRLAAQAMTLVGMTESYKNGTLTFAPDLADNIAHGDANYMAVLDEADAYVLRNGLDLPEEPDAGKIGPDPACVTNPIRELLGRPPIVDFLGWRSRRHSGI